MDQPLGILGTPDVGFFALLVIGGLAGWIAGMVTGARHWLLTNVLVGSQDRGSDRSSQTF
jgi:hypothetical protein